MNIIIKLSGEHDLLPQAEIKSILNSINEKYTITTINNSLLKIKTNNNILNVLNKRIAYSHEISELITKTNTINLENTFQKINWQKTIDKNFAVRVKTINKKINSLELEKTLGHIINQKTINIKVKLKNPNTLIQIFINNNNCYITKKTSSINKKHFFNNKAHKRPFFYPGSMDPKLARCMVNLSEISEGKRLLDPFCGTGGILIEAAIVEAEVYGYDIDKKMVHGSRKNLNSLNLKNYSIHKKDALTIGDDIKFDAIVCDPPYGISASTAGKSADNIFIEFLKSIDTNLVDGGKLCLASPHYINLNDLIHNTSFKISQQYSIRMHKSLTRIISVLELK